AAIQELARGWQEREDTRTLIVDRAQNDPDYPTRRAAIQELARGWQEREDTRTLIVDRAQNDPNYDPRRAAIQELARGWQEREDTRTLIVDRAQNDPNYSPRSVCLGFLAQGLNDVRAIALLSKYFTATDPYLDPLEPISEKHIQKGAKQLGITVDEARQVLADCEPVLGWNPLEPSRSAKSQ
ncbi:MAG: HEAT repeat domain-containing protein, partial [Acidobacteriota bacterium]